MLVLHLYMYDHLGPAIIQWSYQYSCWKLFALELDAFLESVGSGTGEITCTCIFMFCCSELMPLQSLSVVSSISFLYMCMLHGTC